MFDLGRAVGYLLLDSSGFTSGLSTARTSLQQFVSQSNNFTGRMKALGTAFTSAGASMTRSFTTPLIGLGTLAAKSAIDFESAFAGVRKTVDATEKEYEYLGDAILEMSNRMPQSASAIAGVMEVAGQLGIRGSENLLNFTETMIMLGDATNLSSEEAATALARVMNIMGTSGEDVSRMGATIVALGNNFATTESEIVEMTNRLAAGAKLAGFTEAETMALATAMSSVGIQAEAGGTAMVETFNALETAVATGGPKLEEFARISGMTSEEFIHSWGSKPVEALQSFIRGLGSLEENGESTVLVLEELGLTGIRQSNMLKSLGLASELLGDSVELANQAWIDNTALTKEAETRYGTLASQLSMLWNNVKNLAISFGELLMPAIAKATEFVKSITERLQSMDEGQKKTLTTILGVVAVIGPLLLILGKVITTITTITSGVKALFGLLSANPTVLVIAAVIAAIAALVAAFVHFWNTSEEFRNFWINLWETIKFVASAAVDWVTQAIQSVQTFFQTLPETVATLWDNITTKVTTSIQEIVNRVVEWGSSLYNSAQEAFQQLKQSIIDKWNEIVAWFEGTIQDIVTTVTGIGTSLYNAGVDILNQLLAGLQAAWASVSQWVSEKFGWISSMASAAKNAFAGIGDRIKGHAATGIDYVLSDGLWQLHEGETVLSKEESQKRNTWGDSPLVAPIQINVTTTLDGLPTARNQYKYNLLVSREHGVSLVGG